jgi:uncharacterized protein involved in outer membrane biogenesis
MTKRKHRALIWLGSLTAIFLIIVVAAVIFIATLDWNKAKPYITAAASKATGRQLSIDGYLQVDLGWLSRLRASGIKFQNANWSQQPNMAEIGLVDVQLDLWQLLSKCRVVLPTITISQANVVLEKNADGAANWEFPAAPTNAVPEKRTTFPVIEKVIIKDGSLLFVNKEMNTRLELPMRKPRDFSRNLSSSRRKARIKDYR